MQLDFGIVCDQVRKEDNGKLLFIGVYTSDIKVPSFPSDLALSLALSFTAKHLGKEKLALTVALNGQTLISGSAEFDVVAVKKSFAVFPNIPIQLRESGTLEFLVESDGKTLKAWVGDVTD